MCRAVTSSVEASNNCPEENKVSGLLLSRGSEYKDAEEDRGLVEYIPLKEASNIQVQTRRKTPKSSNTPEEEDLQETLKELSVAWADSPTGV